MTTRRTALAAFAPLALTLALTLVACGDDDSSDSSADSASSSSASMSDSASSSASASMSDSASSSGTAAPASDDNAVVTATATALESVPGGTLISLDQEGDGWAVEVIDNDAKDYDLTVSADGVRVTSDPVEDRGDAQDRADHQQLLKIGPINPEDAVEAMRAAVPTGTITALDLELEGGSAVWEIKLDEDTSTEKSVFVDALTGEVLRTEQGD